MLYRIVEHYDTHFDVDCSNSHNSLGTEKNEPKECFVCMDSNLLNEKTIELKNQLIFIKPCMCDGFIHNSCLRKWYNIHLSCPICRNQMVIMPSLSSKILNNPIACFIFIRSSRVYGTIINIYFYNINYLTHFIRHFSVFFCLLIIFSISLEFISFILENKTINENESEMCNI